MTTLVSIDWVLLHRCSKFNNWGGEKKSNRNAFQNWDYLILAVNIDKTFVFKAFLLISTLRKRWYFPNYPAKSGILQSPSCVCLFVCLFVSRISHKLLVGFWWNLVSREVMIIGRPSSKLGVIRIEIRIWDPDNCFSWTTGRILDQDFNQIQDNSNLIIVIW